MHLPADDEDRGLVQGRQAHQALLADPGRVRHEFIKKEALVVRQAPGGGAGGSGRTTGGSHGGTAKVNAGNASAQRKPIAGRVPDAQGVRHDADRTQAHGGGGQHRVEQPAGGGIKDPGGERNPQPIVDEGQEEVLLDDPHDGPAEPHGAGEGREIAPGQDEAGAPHGDVRAGAHRHPDVGRGERGGVVDPVAGEDHVLALVAGRPHDRLLAGGGHLGMHVVEFQLARHGIGGGRAVPADHDQLQAERLQLAHRRGGGILERVGEGDRADRAAIDGHADDSRRGQGILIGPFRGADDAHGLSLHHGGDAHARLGRKAGGRGHRQAAGFRRGDEGAPERVFAGAFGRGGQRQQLAVGQLPDRPHGDDLRMAGSQGPGLVEEDGRNACQPLEGRGILDQHADLGAPPNARDDGDGRGEPQGARAGDDEDGDGRWRPH